MNPSGSIPIRAERVGEAAAVPAPVLRDREIVCVSWLVWDSVPLVMHQMMRRLARRNRVLFVDPPVALSNLLLRPSLAGPHLAKVRKWLGGARRVEETLWVWYPPPLLLQWGHVPAWDGLQRRITAGALRRAWRRLGFSAPILWIYHPYVLPPRPRLGQELVVYDCNDDVGYFYTRHFGYKRSRLDAVEQELARHADVVLATSPNLQRRLAALHPGVHYLPSGIDFDAVSRARDPGLEAAPDAMRFPAPRILFVGGMSNDKMNWEWVAAAARARPRWSLVFVGPAADPPPPAVRDAPNVHFLGPRPADSLPAYLKAADAGIIPYRGGRFLADCYPTKVFEYLAAGKPVVSAAIPALDELGDLVVTARTAEEFVAGLDRVLAEAGGDSAAARRVEAARPRTWDARVAAASAAVRQRLAHGAPPPGPRRRLKEAVLARVDGRSVPVGRTLASLDPRRILVFEGGGMGDLLLLLPALQVLSEAFPRARISLLVSPQARGVLDLFPGRDRWEEILEYDPRGRHATPGAKARLVWQVRRRGFDLILAPSRGEGMREVALMTYLMGARARVGFCRGGTGLLHTHRLPLRDDRPLLEQNLDLLAAAGLPRPRPRVRLELPARVLEEPRRILAGRPRPWVALHPGAAWHAGYKTWPAERFRDLARGLVQDGAGVVLLGGPRDREAVQEIGRGLDPDRTVAPAGAMGVADLAGWIAACRALVANDSGPLHLALWLETPAVGLFGPTAAVQTAGHGLGFRAVQSPAACSPCYLHHETFAPRCGGRPHCMEAIPVAEVREALGRLLEEVRE